VLSFEKFDRDGDGVVSPKDFSRALSAMEIKFSRPDADRLMEILDSDGNGHINYDDFVRFMVGGGGGKDRDDSGRSESDGDDHDRDGHRGFSRGGASRRNKGKHKSDYSNVVGEYSDRLSPRSRSPRGHGRSRSPIFNSDSENDDGGGGALAQTLRKALLHPDAGRGESGSTRTPTDFKTKFSKLDRSRKGYLPAATFKKALEEMGLVGPLKLSRGQWAELLSAVGEAGGKVQYGEFVQFLFAGGEKTPLVIKGRRVEVNSRGGHVQSDDNARELGKLRKKILGGVGDSKGDRANLKKIFKAMDQGDRGNVSQREFLSGLKKCGVVLQRSDTTTLFKRFDTDDDGLFNYEDFLSYLLHPEKKGGHSSGRSNLQNTNTNHGWSDGDSDGDSDSDRENRAGKGNTRSHRRGRHDD